MTAATHAQQKRKRFTPPPGAKEPDEKADDSDEQAGDKPDDSPKADAKSEPDFDTWLESEDW
jgi:hypothetical protein